MSANRSRMLTTLVAFAALSLAEASLSACSRRSAAQGDQAPPPPPAAPRPPPEAEPTTPANATGNALAGNTQSVNDGAFGPDYAPPPPASAPSNATTAAPQH